MKKKEELEKKLDVAKDPVIVHLAQIAWMVHDYAFGQKKRSKLDEYLIKFKIEEREEKVEMYEDEDEEELDEEKVKAAEAKQALKIAQSKAFWMAPLIAAKRPLPPEVMEKSIKPNAG